MSKPELGSEPQSKYDSELEAPEDLLEIDYDDDDDFAKCFSMYDDDDFAERKEAIEELIADYTKKSRNLSPFDAIYHPAVLELCGCVVPIDITEDLRPTLVKHCELALKNYNEKNQAIVEYGYGLVAGF